MTDHPVTAEIIEIYLNELRSEATAHGLRPDTLVAGLHPLPAAAGR